MRHRFTRYIVLGIFTTLSIVPISSAETRELFTRGKGVAVSSTSPSIRSVHQARLDDAAFHAPEFSVNLAGDHLRGVSASGGTSSATDSQSDYGKLHNSKGQIVGHFTRAKHGAGRFVSMVYKGKGYIVSGQGDTITVLTSDIAARPIAPGRKMLPEFVHAAPPVVSHYHELAADPTVIDVMIVYTANARDSYGGDEAVKAAIDASINYANQSYINSEINQRVRLVYSGLVAGTEDLDFDKSLNQLTDAADGAFDQVHALRDQYGADIVGLVAKESDQYCGVGWLLSDGGTRDYGFFVSSISDCLPATVAHEMGHNMGCDHNVEDTFEKKSGGFYNYSLGHRFIGKSGGLSGQGFTTVMAYTNNRYPNEIPYFSNPNVSYGGAATGVTDQEDNARTLNQTATYVAAFTAATDSTTPVTDPTMPPETTPSTDPTDVALTAKKRGVRTVFRSIVTNEDGDPLSDVPLGIFFDTSWSGNFDTYVDYSTSDTNGLARVTLNRRKKTGYYMSCLVEGDSAATIKGVHIKHDHSHPGGDPRIGIGAPTDEYLCSNPVKVRK